MELTESIFGIAVGWLKLILEIIGAALVSIGGLAALGRLIVSGLRSHGEIRFTPVRLHFARYLSLALEFQLAADILGTTIAPNWQQIGKLGAIAVIRTGLNYFLGREMKEEKETISAEQVVEKDAVEPRPTRPAPVAP